MQEARSAVGHLLDTSVSCFSENISVGRKIAKSLSSSCRILTDFLTDTAGVKISFPID